jgi:hypothetical protein
MILLTIIAVGLLSLSSISLRSTTSSSAMSVARQNARLAMMLAIGELQKHAGQDQRVTASADIAGDALGQRLGSGSAPLNNKSVNDVDKGLSTVFSGTRHWTGVWKNSSTASNPASELYSKTPSPQFLQWLVSGNETGLATPRTPNAALCAVGSSGNVTDTKTAVVLVGEKTAGAPSSDSLARYVAVPLVSVAPQGSSKSSGRYGWWVGDEGVKAKINIPKTNNDSNSYASLSTQRRGWETVEGFAAYPTPASIGQNEITKLITLQETPLLVTTASASSGGVTPLQAAFHSATADSRGLLTDTVSGGTRIDLNSILSSGLPASSPVADIANYPLKNANIIPTLPGFTAMAAPKWDALKEFHDRYQNLQGGSLIVKEATSLNSSSIAPLITDLRILMGVKFVPTTSNAGAAHKANACGKIALAIANPYAVPLKWNNDLEFEIRNLTPSGNKVSRIWNLIVDSVQHSIFISSNDSAVFNKAIFRIKSSSLAAGEARAYTLGSSAFRAIGTGTQRLVVDLVPFGTASPFDFKKCVELDTQVAWPYIDKNNKLVTMPALDVREEYQTTYIGLDMRLAGSSSSAQPLRRIEGFELDNGYFSPNTRRYSASDCQQRPNPVPLMCYSFQISQPGVDYLNLMPSGYALGQRSSTMRTFMDFNLQATRISRPVTSYNAPPYFMESNNGFAQLPDQPSGQTGSAFTKNLDSPMPWGRGFAGSSKTVLFGVPSQFTSLAQFQHADLTGDDKTASIGHQPGNAFANSYATPFVKRAQTFQSRTDYVLLGKPNPTGSNKTIRGYYDISHLLNTAIWDTYFLSSISGSTSNGVPENTTLVPLNSQSPSPDLKDPVKCAPNLMIDGVFNINCTDKNAWKAFLASSRYFRHNSDTGVQANAAFPRSLQQPNSSTTPPSGISEDSFAGFRRLSDVELDLLATEITKQVRLRGPFVSLSHFVNRALADIAKHPALTRAGALQSAIDESGININFAGNLKGLAGIVATTDRLNLSEKNNAPRADLDGSDTGTRPTDVDADGNQVWAATSTDNNFGSVASIIADRTMLSNLKQEQGYRSTGIPGWLTQADVLQVIGPSISARSDTFRIRAYGESVDASGNTLAKAYCEAIVQRFPDYVDPANKASERSTSLTNLNKTYGRKFDIVSFRWLSSQEI